MGTGTWGPVHGDARLILIFVLRSAHWVLDRLCWIYNFLRVEVGAVLFSAVPSVEQYALVAVTFAVANNHLA